MDKARQRIGELEACQARLDGEYDKAAVEEELNRARESLHILETSSRSQLAGSRGDDGGPFLKTIERNTWMPTESYGYLLWTSPTNQKAGSKCLKRDRMKRNC